MNLNDQRFNFLPYIPEHISLSTVDFRYLDFAYLE